MSIKENLLKIKPFYNLLLILVISSIFFAFGRISAIEERHLPIKIEYGLDSQAALAAQAPGIETSANESVSLKNREVIGSKSGKKYYFPWCSTVKRIKPENQVHFTSIDAAKTAGFSPGRNCKGLK